MDALLVLATPFIYLGLFYGLMLAINTFFSNDFETAHRIAINPFDEHRLLDVYPTLEIFETGADGYQFKKDVVQSNQMFFDDDEEEDKELEEQELERYNRHENENELEDVEVTDDMFNEMFNFDEQNLESDLETPFEEESVGVGQGRKKIYFEDFQE